MRLAALVGSEAVQARRRPEETVGSSGGAFAGV